jgi:hypothetical protein
MIASIKNIDPEIKKFVSRTISDLIRLSLKNLRTSKRKPGAEALTENCAGSLGSRSMQTP